MTSEMKTTIGPEDILAMELECAGCGSIVSRPIKDCRLSTRSCPNCGAMWIDMQREFQELERLVLTLRMFSSRASEKSGMPFRVKFEIAQPRKASQ